MLISQTRQLTDGATPYKTLQYLAIRGILTQTPTLTQPSQSPDLFRHGMQVVMGFEMERFIRRFQVSQLESISSQWMPVQYRKERTM